LLTFFYSFLVKTQFYRRVVNRIATVSLGLAAMTPHVIFAVTALGLFYTVPNGIVSSLAPGCVTILSWLYPLVCTVLLLHEYAKEAEENKEQQLDSNKENDRGQQVSPKTSSSQRNVEKNNSRGQRKTTRAKRQQQEQQPQTLNTTGPFPRTKATVKRRNKRQSTASRVSMVSNADENTLDGQLNYWLRFWMVRGALQVVKIFLGSFIRRTWVVYLKQLEFFFYVYLFALPFIIPQKIGNQKLPESRPLQVLVSLLSPSIKYVHEGVSNIVPETFWRGTIVATVSRCMDVAVLVGFLSQNTADWLSHAVEESRHLLLPSLTLFMPLFTQYGSIYVQYIPMIAKSTEGDKCDSYLKYWVLNAIVGATLQKLSPILWWIPFSSHATFILWSYLRLQPSVESLYRILDEELAAFGLLPGCHQTEDLTTTRTGKFGMAIFEALPKASDVSDNANMPRNVDHDDNDNSSQASESKGRKFPTRKNTLRRKVPARDSDDDDDDDDDDEDYVPSPIGETTAARVF
jgi:hypothetical protein